MLGDSIFLGVTFLLHFTSALFLTWVALSCNGDIVTNAYTESTTDPTGFIIIMNATCSDPYSKECFFGMAQSYDIRQEGLQWNVFALLAGFEWLSASFALYYLSEWNPAWIHNLCVGWNLAGLFIFMPYAIPLTLLQSALTGLSLIGAGIMQFAGEVQSGLAMRKRNKDTETEEDVLFYASPTEIEVLTNGGKVWQIPKKKAHQTPTLIQTRITLHYSEYCASASLLFVAVLILFIQGPPSWAATVGFVGVFLCNLTGIMAHLSKIDQRQKPQTKWYNLDWVNDGNHFKLFLLHSWTGLILAVGVILYLGRSNLTSTDIPWWVRLILWNLLVTFALFGIWATLCYALMGAGSDKWMGRLDYGLSALSVAAKLPVAFTVYYGLVMKPGGRSC